MRQFLSNSAWVMGGQIITSLSALIGMVFLSYLLSPEDLGSYRFVLAALMIATISTLPGLDTALVRSTARNFSGQLSRILWTKIRWGVWGSVFLALGSLYFFVTSNHKLGFGFLFVSCMCPLFGSFFIYFFYLQGKEKFKTASMVTATGRVIFLGLMVSLAWLFPHALGALVAFTIAVVLSQAWGYWWVYRRYAQNEAYQPDGEVISYGKELTLLGAWNIIATHIDKALVWFFLGPVAVAVYTIATLLPLESIRIGRIISQVLLPRFSQHHVVSITHLLPRVGILFATLVLVWGLFALLAQPLYGLLFPQYTESVPYAVVAMLVMLSAPAYIIRSYFTGTKNQRALRILLIGVPITKTLLLVILLWQYGLWGAIWAIALGGGIELIVAIGLLTFGQPASKKKALVRLQ